MDEEGKQLEMELATEDIDKVEVDGNQDEHSVVDAVQDRLMAIIAKSINNKLSSFLTRLSQVEAAQERPRTKKRCISAGTNNLDNENTISEAEKGEMLMGP